MNMLRILVRYKQILKRVFPLARDVQIRRAMSAINFKNVKHVLVVGAGQDPYRKNLKNVEKYIRLDIRYIPEKVDIVADTCALPCREGTFQCVISTEVIEYLSQPKLFATEMQRVLATSGFGIVSVPFLFADHDDCFRPTRRTLSKLFKNFSSVSIYAQGNRVHTIWDLLTTSFKPYYILFPLRVFTNVMFLSGKNYALHNSRSSAPTGFFVVIKK
jgi:hypothetical protein